MDRLNFTIDPMTGYRLAPDGSPFNITLEVGSSCGGPTNRFVLLEAFNSLSINGDDLLGDWNDFYERAMSHDDFDMIYYATNFYDNSVDWLGSEFWSENADVYRVNLCNFRNSTYDSWRDQLLHGTTYDDVFEACSEMQKILQYNVPRIVMYEGSYLQAYRNDKFTGHVPDLQRYISGLWTIRNIRQLDGSLGGTVTIGLSQEPDSFNIFATESTYSEFILEEIYSALYLRGPDLNPVPDLANSILIETHANNPDVPLGHIRFTIGIIQNATWSDGVPLTAEDVAFTLNYMHQLEPDPDIIDWNWDFSELFAAYSPSPYRVIVEFSTESYWYFENFAYHKIVPKHVYTSDIYSETHWNDWQPVFNPEHPLVTSRPFIFSDYDAGQYYELTQNPEFYYRHEPSTTTVNTTTPTTPAATNNGLPQEYTIAIAFGSMCVIVVFSGEFIRLIRGR